MRQKSFIIFIFSLTLLLTFGLSFAKMYYNPSADVIYTLNADGSVNVHEEIVYSISCSPSDCYHELYTWHPPSLKIINASGYCIETDCRFYTQYNNGNYELVLRKDEGFKTGTYTAVFDYVLPEEILEQKDIAQFFYKVWYDQWPKDIGRLQITLVLPNPVSGTLLYTHNSTSSQINVVGNKIEIFAENYPSNNYYEVNLLMPKNWFTSLRKADNYMTREEIIKKEETYLSQQSDINLLVCYQSYMALYLSFFLYYCLFICILFTERMKISQSCSPFHNI